MMVGLVTQQCVNVFNATELCSQKMVMMANLRDVYFATIKSETILDTAPQGALSLRG